MIDRSAPGATVTQQRPAWHPAMRADDATPPRQRAEGMGFWDFVDIINPLQHIPVVSTVYRELTGDTIRPEARILGATLFGGPIGLALSAADAVIEAASGDKIGRAPD